MLDSRSKGRWFGIYGALYPMLSAGLTKEDFLFLFVCFVALSYDHGGKVSSPNHTFSWASLNEQLTSATPYNRLF